MFKNSDIIKADEIDISIDEFIENEIINWMGIDRFVGKMEDLIQIYNYTEQICFNDKQIYLVAN